MDKEFIEKVIRLVIETLDDMDIMNATPSEDIVKIWSHKNPLPDPIEVKVTETEQPEEVNRVVNISRYVK